MIRTTIHLEQREFLWLKREAKRRKCSMSSMVREWIAQHSGNSNHHMHAHLNDTKGLRDYISGDESL
jgi:predicted DNA-binding ribbon-helix-helix protein